MRLRALARELTVAVPSSLTAILASTNQRVSWSNGASSRWFLACPVLGISCHWLTL
jgi:hypothetical protein